MSKLTASAEAKAEERARVAWIQGARLLGSEGQERGKRGRGRLCVRLLFILCVYVFPSFLEVILGATGDGAWETGDQGDSGWVCYYCAPAAYFVRLFFLLDLGLHLSLPARFAEHMLFFLMRLFCIFV